MKVKIELVIELWKLDEKKFIVSRWNNLINNRRLTIFSILILVVTFLVGWYSDRLNEIIIITCYFVVPLLIIWILILSMKMIREDYRSLLNYLPLLLIIVIF